MIKYYLSESAKNNGLTLDTPKYGDAGIDIRSNATQIIPPNGLFLVPTGLYVEIPHGYVGFIKDRSSMALKRIVTSGGVIDSSYRGEVKIILSNNSDKEYIINIGDKIAQMVVFMHNEYNLKEVDSPHDLSDTTRNINGFGSTGK